MRYRIRSLENLLELFLSTPCPLCARPTPKHLCQDCESRLQQLQFLNPGELWQPPFPVFAWGKYGGALKRAIAALKYDNQPQLARPLGHWLGQAWLKAVPTLDPPRLDRAILHRPTVVPIPLHASRQRQRGYNQAALLATAFCEATRMSQASGLVRIRATEAQFSLNLEARSQNLTDAFAVSQAFQQRPPKTVLLLDDIYTTGATVRSAAQVLQQRQILVLGVVVVAKAGASSGAAEGHSQLA